MVSFLMKDMQHIKDEEKAKSFAAIKQEEGYLRGLRAADGKKKASKQFWNNILNDLRGFFAWSVITSTSILAMQVASSSASFLIGNVAAPCWHRRRKLIPTPTSSPSDCMNSHLDGLHPCC